MLQILNRAEDVIRWVESPMERTLQALPRVHPPAGRMRVGVDLGTAYLVLVVLDEHGQPVTGEYQFARVVRDGVVVDYVGAVDRLSAMKQRVESSLGVELKQAFGSYPPGVPQAEVRAVANVIEAAGMLCSGLIDEPTAANALLGLENGVIVDVGGGTTGIAILSDGKVVYSSDEPTGGVHFSLVIAGAHDISFEEAEAMKIDPSQQERLFPTIRPVMEKVASIIARHLDFYQQGSGQSVDHIVLVGGTSKFPGIAGVIEDFTGIRTEAPAQPLFVTPIGIALHDHILV